MPVFPDFRELLEAEVDLPLLFVAEGPADALGFFTEGPDCFLDPAPDVEGLLTVLALDLPDPVEGFDADVDLADAADFFTEDPDACRPFDFDEAAACLPVFLDEAVAAVFLPDAPTRLDRFTDALDFCPDFDVSLVFFPDFAAVAFFF